MSALPVAVLVFPLESRPVVVVLNAERDDDLERLRDWIAANPALALPLLWCDALARSPLEPPQDLA